MHFDRALIAANTGAASGSLATGDCCAAVPSGNAYADDGHTVFAGDTTGCPTGGVGSVTVTNANISALADNGGLRHTVALNTASPAIDIVPFNICPNTDERGLTRPQGAACDAGAYEYAPPTIAAGAAAAGSTTTATVTATINPNLSSMHTTALVKYGTSTAYGSITPVQELGNGSGGVAYTAAINGLTAGTTYHYVIVATNGDGTTTTADTTFATDSGQSTAASVLSVAASGATTLGPKLTLNVACNAGDVGAVCSGPITLASHVTSQGKTVVSVAASATRKRHKNKPKPPAKVTTLQTIGGSSYSVATGRSQTVTVLLNATGMKLLSQLYTVPATVSIGSTTPITTRTTFRNPKISSVFSYQARDAGTDTFRQLSVLGGVPVGAIVSIVCATGRCSPRQSGFELKGNNIKRSSKPFRRLRPGAAAYLEITKPNFVGIVLKISNPGSGRETATVLCLPPGTKTPGRCAT